MTEARSTSPIPTVGPERLEAILHAHGVERDGAGGLWKCPFHDDRHGSLSIFPKSDGSGKALYKCQACGEKGDALDFIMRHTGADFRAALERLGADTGQILPLSRLPPAHVSPRPQKAAQIGEFNCIYQRIIELMPLDRVAESYLRNHGLSLEEAERFGLRALPPGRDQSFHLAGKLIGEFPRTDLEAAGLIGTSKTGRAYWRMFNRLIISHLNAQGEVIYLQGRALADGKPKYLNVTGQRPRLYVPGGRYDLATLEDQRLWICEGAMDALALHVRKAKRAVALLSATDGHLDQLARDVVRGQVPGVVIVADADPAGGGLRDSLVAALARAEYDLEKVVIADLQGAGDVAEWITRPTYYEQAARDWRDIEAEAGEDARRAVAGILDAFPAARIVAVSNSERMSDGTRK